MKAQHKKILIAVTAVGGAYLMYRYFKAKGDAKKLLTQTAQTPEAATPPVKTSYPIKQGSTGAAVMALQKLLGLTVDGIFGPKTGAALNSKLGTTVIANDSEMQAALNKLTAAAAAPASAAPAPVESRAETLSKSFAAGAKAILAIATTKLTQGVFDFNGAFQPNGQEYTLTKAKTYNNKDWRITGFTKSGKVIVVCSAGALAGTYVADAAALSLVAA